MEVTSSHLSNDENLVPEHVVGIPISSTEYPVERSPKGCHNTSDKNKSSTFKQNKNNSMLSRMKLGKKTDNFVHGVRDHVRLGPRFTETVKGKLRMGARILKAGGVENVFKRFFSVRKGDKLLKASQCYLSTTAGPIAGLLFISSDKVAFCSERSIKFSSNNGEFHRFHYKILIPLGKIKRINQAENVKKPSQKYLEIVTVDNFDFWFMGFLNYQKALKYLQKAISQTQNELEIP